MNHSSEPALRAKTVDVLMEAVSTHTVAELGLGVPDGVRLAIQRAFAEMPAQESFDLAFHLSDWRADAAFLMALQLAPERFTAAEVRAGVTAFLVHAPNHLAAAAKLGGWPIEDVFGIGALGGEDATDSPAV
jgi:hypothetical protein